MKTNILNNLPVAAFAASFLLIPFNTHVAGLAFTLTGVVAMLYADYGRTLEPVRTKAEIIAFGTGLPARALKAA
jgi:hypothetical protein